MGQNSQVCPPAGNVAQSHFTVSSCTSATATVAFANPLKNGKCLAEDLSWVTVASLSPTNASLNKCFKLNTVSQGETVTLTGVPCNSIVAVFAHDGSYKAEPFVDVDFLGSCSDGSGSGHCGPYGNYVLKCDSCSLA